MRCLLVLCVVSLQCGTDMKGGLTSIFSRDRRAGEEVEAGLGGLHHPSGHIHQNHSLSSCTHAHATHTFQTEMHYCYKRFALNLSSLSLTCAHKKTHTYIYWSFHYLLSLLRMLPSFFVFKWVWPSKKKQRGSLAPCLFHLSAEQGERCEWHHFELILAGKWTP